MILRFINCHLGHAQRSFLKVCQQSVQLAIKLLISCGSVTKATCSLTLTQQTSRMTDMLCKHED